MGSGEESVVDRTSRNEDDQVPGLELTPARARRLVLKTDLVIMPLAVLSMTLAFLDKNALGYAAVLGIKTDAHLHGQQYSWLSSIFYFSYLAMEFPNLWLMTRLPIGKYVGSCLTIWGALICVMAACHSFASLAAVRFLLGVFEAAILPCMMLLNSMWYRREEQPLRTAFWYNTFAGVFGGILSYAIGKIDGPLSTWRYIFLIYGAVTVLCGGLFILAMPDSPSKAWFFTAQEKELAVVRLASNQTGIDSKRSFKLSQIWEAARDPKCYCIWICALGYAVANAGITNFNPLIISGYGFSSTKTTLMATPQAAVAMVSQAILTAITFFLPNLRCIFWVASSLVGLVGALMVHLLDIETQRDASLAGVYLMGFYNVPWVFMLSLSSSNTAGATKKSFMGISVAVVYAVGNIIGPQFFLDEQSPTYPLGIGSMLCAFAVMAAAGLAYYVFCVLENRRRNMLPQRPDEGTINDLDANDQDLTDWENLAFRYTY
ncbi:major facilitator superfamily domain-containing protein [Pestalotiopsis sp. NC0098]|nr:major facilitator superfamily domain-containing protein [Pestalotiopsis sp. NC0098]